MESGIVVSEAGGDDPEAVVEGKTWCPRCDRETPYLLSKVEFLGTPIKASFFCLDCGSRVHPEAADRESALRLRSQARWLRLSAAGSFFLILLLPLVLVALALYLLWRLL